MTSLLFRVISAHRCRSTHHHIAIGALTLLKGEHAERWHDLMLVMHDDLLKGAKAPDSEFKDFKNHVLHIEEGEWGGARDAALEWYAKSVMALKAKKWSDAAYALGVMSHYYADPIQPFHTGQTEEEGAIHRAVEWSIAKSRPEIARRIEAKGYPVVPTGEGPGFVSDMVRAGAEKSHPHYQTFLDHYNVDAGVKVPEDGLDETLLDVISDLVAYATSGLAAIYMRAFEEAGVAPPKSNLSINGFLSTLDIPIRWITSKLEDANDRRIVTAMYEELRKTGKVIKKLPDDDKQIRKMHAQQVLRIPLKELDAQRMRKIGEKHVARAGAVQADNAQTEAQAPPTKVMEDTASIAASAASAAMPDSTIAAPAKDASIKVDKKAERLAIKEAKQAEKQRLAQEKADAKERAKAEKAAAAQAKIEAAANAKAEKVAALQAKADEEARIKADEKAAAEKAATEKAEAAKQARAEADAKKEAEERAAAQAKAAKQAEKDEKRKNRGQSDCNETAEAAALLAAAHKTAAQREAEQRETEQRAAEASAIEAKQQPAKSTNTEPQTEKPKYRVKTTGEYSETKSKEYDEAESAFAAQLKQVSKGTRFEPVENDPDEDIDVTTYDAMIDAMDDDDLGLNEDESSETADYEEAIEEDTYTSSRTSRREPLSNESPIVDAPSIGKKTAARMRNVGIHTVGDFVQAKAKDLSAKLGGGYMSPATLIDWQDQALLMIDMPSLRVHDAQILVGAGVRCVEDLAESSSRDLFASAVSFLKTKDGARIAQNGNALDHEEVYDWIEEAQAAFA